VNDLGGKAHDKRTGKVSKLEVWEGYRVFRDARSPTGWIDQHRIPIVGIDTNGHAFRLNLRTGKAQYVDPTPSDGGFFSGGGPLAALTDVLKYNPFDVFGQILNVTGQGDLNEIRQQAGVAATVGIVSAGGLGATTLGGLTGASSTAGGLSTLLGGGAGGFASLVGSPVSAAGIVPVGPAPAAQTSSRPTLGPVFVLVIVAGVALVLLSRKSR
jgi:hypothetical protein